MGSTLTVSDWGQQQRATDLIKLNEWITKYSCFQLNSTRRLIHVHVDQWAHMNKQTCINTRMYAHDHRRAEIYAHARFATHECVNCNGFATKVERVTTLVEVGL